MRVTMTVPTGEQTLLTEYERCAEPGTWLRAVSVTARGRRPSAHRPNADMIADACG